MGWKPPYTLGLATTPFQPKGKKTLESLILLDFPLGLLPRLKDALAFPFFFDLLCFLVEEDGRLVLGFTWPGVIDLQGAAK